MFHRGLFEQHLLNPVVMRDRRFVAAVLLVCALGAGQIAVDDLQRGEGFNPTELAPKPEPAGWEFFVQAEPFLRMPTPEQPQLLDVQIFYLAAQYFGIVLGSFTTWVLLGTAAQLAFQANAHRLGAYKQQPNLTDELWKRTFWSLVMTDRLLASLHGRPLFIKDHTFDLDLPLEVDDDRWDLSTPGFPLLGPPTRDLCSSTFLIWHIRLSMISGFITQTLHSTNRSRLLLGFVGPDWEHHTMKHLDSLLSEWAANFPPELRWDPETPNLEIFTHSSLLCALYYSFVITAHNPFVRTTARNFSRANLHNTTGLDLTVSLAKCTEAALKCIDILLAVLDRHPWCLGQVGWSEPPFTSCLVLLVNLFGFKSSLTEAGIARFTRAIRICLDALNIISIRIKLAARFGDLLNQLVEELDHEIPMVSYSTPSPKHTDTSVASALRSEPPAAPISRPPTTPLSKDSTPERANSSFDMDELPLGLREQMVNGLRKVSPPSQLN